MSKKTIKVLFFGMPESGKSTILKLISGNKISKDDRFLPTIDYNKITLLVNDEIEVIIFDLGGATAFLDRFTGELAEFMFSGLATFVFIVDSIQIQVLSRVKYYLDLVLKRIEQYCPRAQIFLFQHKVDLVPQKMREEVYQTVREYLLKDIVRDIHYYETSIYEIPNNSFPEATRAVLESTVSTPLTSFSRIRRR